MNTETKRKIFETWLENIPFDGINVNSLKKSAESLGHETATISSLFPQNSVSEALKELSHHFDLKTIEQLEKIDIEPLAIRERIKIATMTRLKIMNEHKEAYRKITAYWAHPLRGGTAKKIIWNTADKIWCWAGDKSTDYNHYTKRFLLSGVLFTTYLYWVRSKDNNLNKTEDFLVQRIENVVKIGKTIKHAKENIFLHRETKKQ